MATVRKRQRYLQMFAYRTCQLRTAARWSAVTRASQIQASQTADKASHEPDPRTLIHSVQRQEE